MSLPLRAYLLLRYGNDWSVEVCRDLGSVIKAWDARPTPHHVTGVLHLGFHRPPTDTFLEVAQAFPGRLLLTAAAKYGMPPEYAASDQPVGYADYLPVFLGTLGWGYALDAQELTLSIAPIPPPAPLPQPEGWVEEFIKTDVTYREAFRSATIHNEPSYLVNEGTLTRDLRYQSGLFRYRKLIGADDQDPCAIARSAPPWLQERAFNSMELSVRVANVFANMKLKLVKELCPLNTDALLRFPNFGRKSVRDLQHSLVHALREGPVMRDVYDLGHKSPTDIPLSDERSVDEAVHELSAPSRRVWNEGFLVGFQETFSTLFPRDGDVLSRRMGLYGPFETLQEIADDYDLTRERIRQIENRAIKRLARNPDLRMLLTSKLEFLLSTRNFPLPLLGVEAVDKWFLGLSKSSTALPYILETLSENKFGITRIEGVDYLGYLTQQRWDDLLSEVRRLLETGVGQKWSKEDCKALVEAQIPESAREFRPLLWDEASKLCHFALDRGGRRVLVGYGHGAERAVLAVLSAATEPLHYGKIAKIAEDELGCEHDVRRIHNAAASVAILLGRGIYGLEKHIALLPEDADIIREEAEDCVLSGPLGRQWHVRELLATLMERDFPASLSLDKYTLDYVLQKSTALSSLGRLVWTQTKTGSEGVSDRLDIRQAIISLLQNAGTPLSAIEIKQGIVAQRGVNMTFQIISADPVVRIRRGVWGLNDRDIPLKRTDQPHFIERLIWTLAEQGTGIHISEIHSLASPYSPPTVSPQTIFSLAVQDDRMRANSEQFLFLSEWGSARRESLSAAILSLLAEADHGISFEEIVKLAETRLQRSLNKAAISKCLQTLNTRYDEHGEKWILASPNDQTLDEDESIEDSPNLDQPVPVPNSILKVPFPFLTGL